MFFAPGCTSGYRNVLCAPPLEDLSQWDQAILRADKELREEGKVSDDFVVEGIAKTYRPFITRKVIEIDQAYWALKDGTVSVNCSNFPSYLSRKQTRGDLRKRER
ncbi:hypothetical protein HPB48_012142 [Haemaphysalis longicornis]|uniref:Uncharacterized protein n=1 Tax=Haemaphysalis longicornis TaxID=44386 RepID=A0A9J6GAS6_HAELO|nr:hypothetical protein HPB48_012142 [Haemaphysalis longicornis]